MATQYKTRAPTDRLMNVERGEFTGIGEFEDALFCYWCGHLLSEIRSGNAANGHNAYSCTSCGQTWPRVFSSCCVDDECWMGFNHFYSPVRVKLTSDKKMVKTAEGFTLCECGISHLYLWSLDDGTSSVTLVGLGRDGRYKTRYEPSARDAISSDS